MTETRKWTFGAVAVVLVLILAGWFLLIAPKKSQAADLETQTQAQLDKNQQLQTQIALLKQQAKNLPEKQAALAQLNTKIPAEADLPSLIQQLSTAAAKSGVNLTEITPSAPAGLAASSTTTTVPSSLVQITLQMKADGGYFELQQFFSQLERMDRALLVTNATIAAADPGSETTAEASQNMLTANITGQVFVAPEQATTDTSSSGSTTTSTTTSAQ